MSLGRWHAHLWDRNCSTFAPREMNDVAVRSLPESSHHIFSVCCLGNITQQLNTFTDSHYWLESLWLTGDRVVSSLPHTLLRQFCALGLPAMRVCVITRIQTCDSKANAILLYHSGALDLVYTICVISKITLFVLSIILLTFIWLGFSLLLEQSCSVMSVSLRRC